MICAPASRVEKLKGFVISLDWHQVLDRARSTRADGVDIFVGQGSSYFLLNIVKTKIAETVHRIQQEVCREVSCRQFQCTDVHMIVVSYTRNIVYRDRVLALERDSQLSLAVTIHAREGIVSNL